MIEKLNLHREKGAIFYINLNKVKPQMLLINKNTLQFQHGIKNNKINKNHSKSHRIHELNQIFS